ncbi:MAG: long-chain fatty acid--CoA ligase [Thermoanaerobaculia bacterium]|nr:long-chain fatty acid--CoA ligase [Thermoanaerobaculia bacterium]
MEPKHLSVVFNERIAKYGSKTILRHRQDGVWKEISWTSLGDQVRAVAKALIESGVMEGEMVGIFAGNRPEWTIADLAAIQTRAVSVPIYPTSTASQAQYIINDARVKVLFAGGQDQYDKAKSIAASCPSLSHIVVMDASVALDHPAATSFAQFLEKGKASTADPEIDQRLSRASSEDLLTLIYTSGTTGEPKGVMLTHGNVSVTAGYHDERLLPLDERDVSLCFLPLSHVFERAWTYYTLYKGVVTCYCDDPAHVIEFLQQARPTVMCAVPRFYEKIYATVLNRLESAPPSRRRLFHWAVRTGAEYGNKFKEEERIPLSLRVAHALADRLVLKKIRAITGGRVRFFPCAGAPLSQEIEEFFYAAGMYVCYGYGLTETTATVTCHEPRRFKFGTVGKPLSGIDVKIADNGEILVRGRTVMKGYYNKPAETAAVFSGSWFRTGDAGVIEEGGYLRITDRIKDLMKTSGGKYIAPQMIESLIGADHYIEQVVVIGDGRNYVTALVVPSFPALEAYAAAEQIPFTSREDLVSNPRVIEFYRKRIEERSKDLARFEKIKKFTLLAKELTIDGGEITPTMKVRRKAAASKYEELIEAMYQGGD